jgi:hypothetical protein
MKKKTKTPSSALTVVFVSCRRSHFCRRSQTRAFGKRTKTFGTLVYSQRQKQKMKKKTKTPSSALTVVSVTYLAAMRQLSFD